MKLLLLSNSTNFGESYMAWCAKIVADFIAGYENNIIFIPYAAVGFSYDSYTAKVNEALEPFGVKVKGVHSLEDPKSGVENASAVFIGGGNTFHLLKTMQDLGLVDVIQNRVKNGMPYAGWSAGSNVAGPTICTTNDMPIVEPQSFKSFGFISQQINPHYTNKSIPNHGGETRLQRLEEYLAANKDETVLCLPEASYLLQSGDALEYNGNSNCILMKHGKNQEFVPNRVIS